MAAISIDWSTKVIFVPKAYTTLITPPPPQEIRRLDTDVFRKDLKALEASPIGMAFLDTHRHNTTVEVGGVILARVIEIINGYTITFEDGQYSVNLVGSNNNIADVTNVNQVSIRSANSAGLQDLSSLQAASFQSRITIDVDKGVPGTLFPIGTEGSPVDNLTDALTISTERGIRTFQLKGSLALDQDLIDYTVIGGTSHFASMLILNGYDVDDTRLINLIVTGAKLGRAQYEDCMLMGVTGLSGLARRCGITGATSTISDGADFLAVDCYSEVAGTATPLILVGVNSTFQFRRYSGGMELGNVTAGVVGSFDMSQGTLFLNANCTGGLIGLRGVGRFERFDGGAVTVNTIGYIGDPSGKLRRRLNMAQEADSVYREIE